MKLKIIPIAIIIIVLISPFTWAAGDKVDVKAADKKIDTKVDEGKVIDKTKESKKDIVNVPKELDGKIKVKDSDTSKYKVEKTDKNSIKITKDEVVGEHTKTEVSVDTAYLTELDKQANADGYIGYMRKVDGQVTDVQKIKISDISAGGTSTIPATFSEVIVSGFSGTKTTTFNNVVSGQTLDIQDSSPDAVTVSVGGSVPSYVSGIPTNGLFAHYTFDGNSNDIANGNNGTDHNMSYGTDYAIFNGIDAYISIPSTGINDSFTIITDINFITTPPSKYIFSQGAVWTKNGTDITTDSVYVADNDTAGAGFGSDYIDNGRAIYTLIYNSTHVSRYKNTIVDHIAATSTVPYIGIMENNARIGDRPGIAQENRGQGNIYDMAIYTVELNVSETSQAYAGGSGVSFKPSPSYNFTGYDVSSGVAKTIDIDSTVNGIEVINTAGTTLDSVTVVEYFTEDTTKISDTTNATTEVVHISHSSPSVKTAGTITYQVAPLYSGTPALVSNNPNATVSRNATSFIVSTGYLPTGTTYNYTVTVANDNNHGMWLNRVLQWMGSGFGFVGEPPTDYTTYIGDQIEVTVS